MAAVYAMQTDIVWENYKQNHHNIEQHLEKIQIPQGSLVVLPELFNVGFTFDVQTHSEQATNHATETWCSQTAKRFGIYLQGACIDQPDASDKALNTAMVYDPTGKQICKYHKIHPFTGSNEPNVYQGGNTIATFHWQGLTVCPLICYDLRFPELWRLATINYNVTMFTCGANWPAVRQYHWETLLTARAIENQTYVIGVNRCGSDPNFTFAGSSRIIDPKGSTLTKTDNKETIISATIDPNEVTKWRKQFIAIKDIHQNFLGSI